MSEGQIGRRDQVKNMIAEIIRERFIELDKESDRLHSELAKNLARREEIDLLIKHVNSLTDHS